HRPGGRAWPWVAALAAAAVFALATTNLFLVERGFEPAPAERLEDGSDAAGMPGRARGAQDMAAVDVVGASGASGASGAPGAAGAAAATTLGTPRTAGVAGDALTAQAADAAPPHKPRTRLTLAELVAHPLFDGSVET